MTEINEAHAEWAVVDRLGKMLREAASSEYSVTGSFALFSSILCWVLQHIRIDDKENPNLVNSAVARLYHQLVKADATEGWIPVREIDVRVVGPGVRAKRVPKTEGFVGHSAARFLKNLRDAMAHGDSRIVRPFNVGTQLLGFTFECSEIEWKGREKVVKPVGKVTLLAGDMKDIGVKLALMYCDTVRHAKVAEEEHFERNSSAIQESAAPDTTTARG